MISIRLTHLEIPIHSQVEQGHRSPSATLPPHVRFSITTRLIISSDATVSHHTYTGSTLSPSLDQFLESGLPGTCWDYLNDARNILSSMTTVMAYCTPFLQLPLCWHSVILHGGCSLMQRGGRWERKIALFHHV
jgi:hypothetical protein